MLKKIMVAFFIFLFIATASICFANGSDEGTQPVAASSTGENGEFQWPKMLIHMDTSTTAPTYVLSVAWTSVMQKSTDVRWRVLSEASANSKVRMLKEGKAHFWWNTMQSVSELMEGNLAYATEYGGPAKLRIAHPGFNMMLSLAVLGDSGIKTFADVKPGMKYSVPASTPIIEKYYRAIWRFVGINPDDMVEVKFGSFPASQSALSEQKVDFALVDPAGIFGRKINSGPHGIHYLGFPKEEDDPDGYARFREVVPTLYFGVNRFGVANSPGLIMVEARNTGYALENMDTEVVYQLNKWMDENYESFKDTHWAAGMMNMGLFKHMTSQTYIPIHEGAIKYLKEKHMWSDADDLRQKYNVWLSDWYVKAYQEAIAKAKAAKIKIDPSNTEWMKLWKDYKKEIGIPVYKIMSDDEIAEAVAKI